MSDPSSSDPHHVSSPQGDFPTDVFPVPQATSAYPGQGVGGVLQGQARAAAPGRPEYAPSTALAPFEPAAVHEPRVEAQGDPYGAAHSGGAGLPPQGAAHAGAYGPPQTDYAPAHGGPYAGAHGPVPGAPYAAPYAGAAPYAAAVPYIPYAQPKSKVIVLLLALFLGTLGIHNFYLGHTGKGVAQLLISLLSLGSLAALVWIWAVIEGICACSAQSGSHPWGVDAYGTPVV
ncbi:NINE protein [Actinomyces bowdenii]|uniref:NINE protein n=1 Tax=Actinomyces bowdenii TaxID=131109 RepID=A0A3P1V9N9_9ACTO|nr:NINE protein [Actinomyces bowdenii]RRD30934.1 NINE protein [Actinomyces bowdenii]